MNETSVYKEALVQLALFCLAIAATRFTNGIFIPVMAACGVVLGLKGQAGRALGIYAMIMMMICINPNILPKNGQLYGLGLRFGPLLIGLALSVGSVTRNGVFRLPFAWLFLYLLFAVIPSAVGWAPFVSYLKIINFSIFLLGIWFGLQGVARNERDLIHLRAVSLALVVFLIMGSVAILPFPGISTLNGLIASREMVNVDVVNAMIAEAIASGDKTLFCGVTNQSQALAPLLSCAWGWVVCDCLFVERKIRWPHLMLIICALPLLYKTRSRVAILCLLVISILVCFYLPRKLELGARVRRWLRPVLLGGVSLGVVALVLAEMNSDAISRWIRKTNDVEGDDRTLQEAVTASRQKLVDMCMEDFKDSPLIGKGFQVAWYTKENLIGDGGIVLSSPIEKGILPIMILGETGLVGLVIFLVFLWIFVADCSRRRFFITIALMAVLLTTNIGEATFFSPGGIGGIEWVLCIVCGYVEDMLLAVRRANLITQENKLTLMC